MNFVLLALSVSAPREFSGSTTFVLELGKKLISKGIGLTLITTRAGELMFRSIGLDAEFCIIDHRERVQGNLIKMTSVLLGRMIKAALVLRKMQIEAQTVVMATSDLFWDVFPLLFASRKVVRVSSLHLTYPQPFRGFRGAFTNKLKLPNIRDSLLYFQYRLSLLCMRLAVHFVFALDNIRWQLSQHGVPEGMIVPWTPAIDIDLIDSLPHGEKTYDACWIGRYHPQKGCDDLMRVWSRVSRASDGAQLAVIGDVADKLEPLVRSMCLQRIVDFRGPMSESRFSVIKSSKLLLLPSYFEGWPHVMVEAMACGIPIVAYDLPVYKAIPCRGVVRVPIGDEDAMARAALLLIGNEAERQRLGEAAREEALEHQRTWEESVNELLRKIAEIRGDRAIA